MCMKKITLVLCFVTVLVQSSFAWGWAVRDVSRQTSENPTYYLGDQVSFAWILNSTSWGATYKKAGIGSINSSAEMNWQDIVWVNEGGDGYGNNEGIKSATYTVNTVGTWYYSIWLGWGANVGDNGTWSDGNSAWAEGNTSFESSSFTVSALENPLSQTATAYSNYQINLSWTNWNSKNVMIVRRLTSEAPSTAPTQGTAYIVGAILGTGTVVYNSNGTSFNDTGLTPGTGYTYIFYSVNSSYYSTGSSANATTTAVSSATDFFRSKTTGNWNTESSWESSANGSTNWITATSTPTNTANAVSIESGHEVTVNANATSSGLIVQAGGKLSINSTYTLAVTGNLSIESNASTTGTIKDKGTLTVSGTATVKQDLSSVRNWYISSPIALAQSNTLPAGTLWKYNETNTGETASPGTPLWDVITSNEALEVMRGYILKPSAASLLSFNGSLNTGDQSILISRTENGKASRGFNLIGNPYPSFINIDNLASNADLVPTIWIKSYNSGYVFDTYNIPSELATGLSGKAISKYVPPMQAFWVRVASGKTSATVNLLNDDRDHQVNVNNTFRAPATQTINQVLRLKVEGDSKLDEAVVYFNANAANGYDTYDSPKMLNGITSTVPDIYTLVGTEQLVINGMKDMPYETEIPLYFKANASTATSFSLSATEISNFAAGTPIYIKNNLTGKQQIISDGSVYTFETFEIGSDPAFSLIIKAPGTTTGGICNPNEYKDILVYRNVNNQICIDLKSELNKVENIAVYNTMGQKITETKPSKVNTIMNLAFETGVYFVKLNIDNKTITRKVIIK